MVSIVERRSKNTFFRVNFNGSYPVDITHKFLFPFAFCFPIIVNVIKTKNKLKQSGEATY